MPQRFRYFVSFLFFAFLLLVGSFAQAQLNIFEPDNKKKETKKEEGISFGTIQLNTKAGVQNIRKANELYTRGEYKEASIEYYKVVSTMIGSRWYPSAQQGLALSLHRLKLYNLSYHYFAEILKVGPKHPYFNNAQTFSTLLSLVEDLKDDQLMGKALEDYFRDTLQKNKILTIPAKYKDQVSFFMGRYFFNLSREAKTISERRELEKLAKSLLESISTDNAFNYARAQYILGVLFDATNNLQYALSALMSFDRAIKALNAANVSEMEEQVPHFQAKRKDMIELSYLAIARVFYGAKWYSRASIFYRKIPRDSSRWLTALFELAWTSMRRLEIDRTLGILHALESPYFKHHYYPENDVLRAVSYLEFCRFTKVKKIYRDYLSKYEPLIRTINTTLGKYQMTGRLYAYLQKKSTDKVETPQEDLFERILALVRKDRRLKSLFKAVQIREKEFELFSAMDPSFRSNALGQFVQRNLAKERTKQIIQAENWARKRLMDSVKELKSLKSQMLKIYYETLSKEKDLLKTSAAGRMEQSKNNSFHLSKGSNYLYWPFQGEFWVDELDAYRFRIRGQCHKP